MQVVEQRKAGNKAITGIMLESFIMAGNQGMKGPNNQGLEYGLSITDPCISWNQTEQLLNDLYKQLGA
jgi:3-deoxy-7-phosphoheptulonate synthase